MREALVTQAMPQNSWPIVEMRMTALAADEVSALVMMERAGKPAAEIVLMSFCCTAKVRASSRTQPISAE